MLLVLGPAAASAVSNSPPFPQRPVLAPFKPILRESLVAHSQAGLIPSWMPAACISPQEVQAEAVLWETPQPNKNSRKATHGQNVPSAVCTAMGRGCPCPALPAQPSSLQHMPRVAMPGIGRGVLTPSPCEWAVTLSQTTQGFAKVAGSRKGTGDGHVRAYPPFRR